MKAILMKNPGNVDIVDLDIPEIKDDEVLIKIHASGICVNDVRDYKGDCNYSYPRIGGHEFSGEIVSVGKSVNEKIFATGTPVVTYIIDNCNTCYYCKNGYDNVCPDFAHTTAYQNPNGISGFGGFAQYCVAKYTDVYLCSKNVAYEKLAMVEPIACVLNSINQCNIEFGDDVLVIGGGTMGMLHVMLAQIKGARVILSEPMEERRKKALELGANIVIDPINEDVVERVKDITNNLGAKVVFNTTAIPKLALQAIDCAAVCGTIVMFSSLHPNLPVEVNLGAIHSTQKRIIGSQNGSIKTFWQAVQLLNKGLFDPEPLIEKIYSYKEFDEAIHTAMKPDTYKVILNMID